MTYIPQPGTIAARVVDHLRTLGPGVELTSQVLLESIGQPSDWHGLGTSLGPAIDHGLIVKRVEGRRAFWRIAGERKAPGINIDRVHAPIQGQAAVEQVLREAAHQQDAGLGVITGEDIPPFKPLTARVVAVASMQPGDHVTVTGLKAPANLPQAPTCTESQTDAGCEFAMTNTGRLLIDTGDQQIALTKDQADQLMQYLDAQRGIEWEGV